MTPQPVNVDAASSTRRVFSWGRFLAPCTLACLLLQLVACTSAPPTRPASGSDPSTAVAPAIGTWQHYRLPGKHATVFSSVRVDGRDAVEASANASASMLRHRMRMEPRRLGHIRFSWKVQQLIEAADMALREADDSPVRVVLAFEGDRSRFSMKNAMLSELSLALTGEPLPYATLMYVWCNTREPGSVIINPRTDRIRKLVVESGSRRLSRWIDYERDIRADFELAFGEPPGALVGIGIMTDTDNTQSSAQAWYGPLDLSAMR